MNIRTAENRENLEGLIDDICCRFNYYRSRMYRQNARKDYLSLAKWKKRTAKKIGKAIEKRLQYVKRDLGDVDLFLAQDDVYLKPKQLERLVVFREFVGQQQYSFFATWYPALTMVLSCFRHLKSIFPCVRQVIDKTTDHFCDLSIRCIKILLYACRHCVQHYNDGTTN